MNNKKPVMGRPRVPSDFKRIHPVRFNSVEKEAFEKLGYSLADGVRTAVDEFLAARGVRYESK